MFPQEPPLQGPQSLVQMWDWGSKGANPEANPACRKCTLAILPVLQLLAAAHKHTYTRTHARSTQHAHAHVHTHTHVHAQHTEAPKCRK